MKFKYKLIVFINLLSIWSPTTAFSDVFELNELYIDYRNYKMVNPNARNPLIYPEPPKEGINLGLKLTLCPTFILIRKFKSLTTDAQYRSIGLDTRLGVRLSSNLEVGFWHKSQHLLDRNHAYMDKFPSEDAVQIKYYLFQGKKREGLFLMLFNKPLQRAAKKAGVSFRSSKEMIAYDHALKTMYKKSEVSVIQIKMTSSVNLNSSINKNINRVAKALNISFDAVLGVYIYDALSKERDNS